LEADLRRVAEETRLRAAAALESWEIGNAVGITWNLVRRANQYIEQNEPWKLARSPEQAERLNTVLYSAAEATRLLAIFLSPYIPSSCNRILAQLGLEPVSNGAWDRDGQWGSQTLTNIVSGPIVFPRLELDAVLQP